MSTIRYPGSRGETALGATLPQIQYEPSHHLVVVDTHPGLHQLVADTHPGHHQFVADTHPGVRSEARGAPGYSPPMMLLDTDIIDNGSNAGSQKLASYPNSMF